MNEKFRIAGGRDVDLPATDCRADNGMDDLNNHLRRAQKLFKRIQPSNLEYDLIRQKIANQEARERIGCFT